jgi:glycosyltransferase involved in cell wall biosynthesis
VRRIRITGLDNQYITAGVISDGSIEGLKASSAENARKKKLAVFFSHPTQHHSAMFQYLAKRSDLNLKVFYYDPGVMGGMFDAGYGTDSAWDVDLTSGVNSRLLRNLFRGREVNQFRQLNLGVIPAVIKGKYDAILISGYASPSNWLVLLFAMLVGSPIWYQSDTNVLDVDRKHASAFKNFLRSIFFKGISMFLVAGDHNKASYKRFDIAEDRMVWCPIPVDIARYEKARIDPELHQKLEALRTRYGIPSGARVIAFCGKLIERKRPQDLIAALRILARDDTYGFLIGSGEMDRELRDMLTPADRIVITGFVNQSEIPYHMLMAEIGVVCSEWDPHPLVTTEFAMCGKPVVVSNYCGVWGDHDILRPGENGYVYRCGDTEELAAHMSRLLEDDDSRFRMGQRSLVLSADQSAEYAANVAASLITGQPENV